MQTRIDWTTGGLSFYDVDPPRQEAQELFKADHDVNALFDPVPSQYYPLKQTPHRPTHLAHQVRRLRDRGGGADP